jgi:hypothetical protein
MNKTKENLIIVPVGNPIDKFVKQLNYPMDVKDHWRWVREERNYQVVAVQYSDFEPEEGTYDHLIKMKGFKWPIAKELSKQFDMTEWEYIGFYDDDVILDWKKMNRSFEIAKDKNFKAFQISLEKGSESQWPCTQQTEGISHSFTNFIEIMCPVFSRSVLPQFMKLANAYDVYTGWGLDYVLAEYLDIKPAVIHEVTMFHPPRPDTGSGYDKSKAFAEMDLLLNTVFPAEMEKQGRKIINDYSRFTDKTIDMFMKV